MKASSTADQNGERPNSSNASRRIVSLLPPDAVAALGALPAKAICGELIGDERAETSFRPNPAFVEEMHRVIADTGPRSPALAKTARRQKEGYVYVIDLRTPQGVQGAVPPEDIIGAFKVEQSRVVPGSYRRSPQHKIFSRNGLVRLPPDLNDALIAALKASA
jgi:hypothetical protein